MKKCVALFVSILVLATLLVTGCNKQIVDFTYSFNEAIIRLPDGHVVSGEVSSWKDYEGEQIQVVIDDVTYLVHSSNIVLMNN